MGQKIKPDALRVGITKNWSSRWWPKSKREFATQLEEDVLIRRIVEKHIKLAGIVRIDIERTSDNTFKLFLKVARPGLVIGRGGKGIEELSKKIEKGLISLLVTRGQKDTKIFINLNVEELKRTELSAVYTAQMIAWDIEKRMRARRVIKKHIDFIMQNREVQGGKIRLSGRIDGREISRREVLSKGKLPLQTLRANIDYGEAKAYNTYGVIGVKVWLYKGDVFGNDKK